MSWYQVNDSYSELPPDLRIAAKAEGRGNLGEMIIIAGIVI